ncbi:alpha/beta hydrolase [Christiangramia echinicola]|uniref:Predicted hydrolase of the alpha/beta superfamily n=1 Tax=Christiangramia echinicola TaxID=279359 RepID=A0A1H1Q8F2_9FLAO|nr:alpha/beta hydrolase-fold protein [Christiangramia echinicola]SDS19762.1 Predicted hydrolase of the alpha/beta superfamily [Christiangramia echinicola]
MKIKFYLFACIALIAFTSNSQSTASKNVETFSIAAPQLDTIKKIWVYLPESYKTSNRTYPVIYMHDAQNLFDKKTSYAGEWKVDEALDSLKTPEAIIVGIEHGGNKRIDELTPLPHEKYGGGKADSYLDFLVNDLKPHIDSTYRSSSDYEYTGIFGSSLGGLVSFYAAIKYPETFGMIGSYSPSFWFNREIYDLAGSEDLNKNTRFYFLVGTAESEEMVPDLKKMIEVLHKQNIDPEHLKVKFVEDGQHNEAMWSENFTETYLWLMDKSKS